jgi:hypothetical protein
MLMPSQGDQDRPSSPKNRKYQGGRTWNRYALILLAFEKVVQHCFVTAAFLLDLGGIRSTVAIDPWILTVAGALIAVLFAVALWALVGGRPWAPRLLIGLALVDIVGEFIAQGRLGITINVSFIVALLLLVLSLTYERQMRRHAPQAP